MSDGAFLSQYSNLTSKVNTSEAKIQWRQHPPQSTDFYVKPVAFKHIPTGSANFTDSSQLGYVNTSPVYRRMYNLGGGQFAATSRHYLSRQAKAEVYVRPFTVNQSTGAITIGTGAAGLTLTNTDGTPIDTGTINSFGSYIMHQHTSPGAGSNSFTAFRIANNAVAATATTTTGGPQAQPQNNLEAPGNFNSANNTAYHHTQTYDTATGLFRRMSYSFDGTSVALVQSEATPTGYQAYSNIFPVVSQFGAANRSPSLGAGMRIWRDNNGCMNYDLLNLTGGYAATGNFQTVGWTAGDGFFDGHGLQLSNGNQIFYTTNGQAFLRSGNTLTDVTEQADWPPYWRSWQGPATVWPVAQDTWVSRTTSGYELVKFYINPTTLRKTILEVFDFNRYMPDINFIVTLNGMHMSLTGSSNQYLVIGDGQYGNTVTQWVGVWPNPFSA